MWHAVSFGREIGAIKVMLEGDSLAVISALLKDEVCYQSHGQIIEDIRSILRSISSVEVHHVKRSVNMVAHVLAKNAIFQSLEQSWIGECPPVIQSIVHAERDMLV
jgi:hypothetical protein